MHIYTHIYTYMYIYVHVCKTSLGIPICEHMYTHIYDLLAFLGTFYLTLSFTDSKCAGSPRGL